MGAALRNSDGRRFNNDLRLRCPSPLAAAINQAADRNMMTVSEYVRRSVIDKLKADGVDLQSRAVSA